MISDFGFLVKKTHLRTQFRTGTGSVSTPRTHRRPTTPGIFGYEVDRACANAA